MTADDYGNEPEQEPPCEELPQLPPVDARAEVEVAAVYMEVYLTLHAPENGGRDIAVEDIRDALAKHNVVYGINEELIDRMVESQTYGQPVLVAEGTPAQDGADGSIVKHFADDVALKPRERADGTVDFRDLGLIVNVIKGTEICDIIEPAEGVPGTDVRGMTIAPKPGKPARIPQGTNTGLSGDGMKLLALVDGNLVARGSQYNVEPTFTIKEDVGVATGNIDFIGEVNVTENVGEGYLVRAKGNVTVRGMVYGATIEAGGNIVIKNGALNAKLTAGGNIEVKFAENSTISGKGNLKSDSLINCNINCQGELNATGNPGTLMGGQCVVTKDITANYIGSKSYTHTYITVGDLALIAEEKRQLEYKLQELDDEIRRLEQALDYLAQIRKRDGSLPPERAEMQKTAQNTKIQRSIERNPILHRIKEIDESIESRCNISVTAKKILYPNVKIAISNSVLNVEAEYSRCKVICENGEAVIKML